MTTRRAWAAGLLVSAVALGCGSSAGNPYSLAVGSDDGGGGSFVGVDAGTSGPLDAAIERDGVAVRFITLGCAAGCADVEAVATGGYPPYTFAWDDGPAGATRHVCPTSSTNYGVEVTDTGTTGELTRLPETVHVALTASVLACPDGGTGDASVAPSVYWADWTQVTTGSPGTAAGTMSPPGGDVQVSYAGEVGPESAVTGGTTPSGWGPVTFTPPSSFLSATVGNAPPPTGMIALSGTGMLTQTITFSQPVKDPLIAVLAMGDSTSNDMEFAFNAAPTVLSSGNYVIGALDSPGTLTVSGQDLTGVGGTGVIEFAGTFSSFAFTVPVAEQLYDFGVLTVGMRAP